MLNKKYIINIIGTLLLLESIFMIAPLVVSIIYQEKVAVYIALSAAITLISGGILWFKTRNASQEIEQREGFIIVTVIWVVYSIFGALPYFLSGYIPSFTDAFFETISGFTTTGATILKDIEVLPHGLLFWRSMTHLIGGIGILVIFIIILPTFGAGCMALYRAETSSASQGKLHPRVKETAKRLLGIYLSLVFAETIFLLLGGMNLFESLCHSFGTIATGGFSPKNSSIGAYSPYIQYVVMFFMLLAGINFNLHYFALKGFFSKVFKDDEFQMYLIIMLIAGVILSAAIFITQQLPLESSIRTAFFNVVSFMTCTGFTTVDYMQWAPFMWIILLFLMFIGGCAGSTSGSMKVVRYNLLMKNILVQFKKIIHERGVFQVRLNDNLIPEDLLHRTLAFFFIYLFTWGVSSFLLMFLGNEPISSMGIVASCMGGVGPGLGSTMAHCADVHVVGKWILSLDMLLGRLELFSILILFTPYFWKARY
jgi:trk system potassium uptake protein TrkH